MPDVRATNHGSLRARLTTDYPVKRFPIQPLIIAAHFGVDLESEVRHDLVSLSLLAVAVDAVN